MGNKSGKKTVPINAVARPNEKQVKSNRSQESISETKPSWRFSTVDKTGPFAWPIEKPEEATIVSKLHSFDSMTWADIAGKGHHALVSSTLSTEAQKRLQELKKDDESEQLFSFRLEGKLRVICIRHNNIANLLWYDPEHKVAPSTKKHT